MNKFALLNEAIVKNDKDDIVKALKLHKNPQTMVSYFYKVKNSMPDDMRNEIFNDLIKGHLPERKEQSNKRVTKNIKLSAEVVKGIIDNRNKSDIDKLIYQLMNTGRRLQSEIYSAEMKDGELYMTLSKERKIFKPFLLDKNTKGTFEDIQSLKGKFNINSISTQIARKLKPHNLTAHLLRSVYITLIHKFYNPKKLIIDDIANKYLGHKSASSDKYYTRIQFEGNNPFAQKYNKMTLKQLKLLAKERGLKRFSRMKKSDLIDLLTQ